MDWMNSYGIRLLEPFSHRWFHGDVLFIVDLWLWLGLGYAMWLSRRRERSGGNWRAPARAALAAGLAYIGLNAGITYAAEWHARTRAPYARIVIANEVPVAFWRRSIITGNGDGIWQVDGQRLGDVPLARCDLAAAKLADPRVAAFLFWATAPYAQRKGVAVLLHDARFGTRDGGNFTVLLPAGSCKD
jgi:inner membrane protein